jgi:hypothetical protein
MHQIDLSQTPTAAFTSAPAAGPAADQHPRWIRVGRGTYPFSSYAAASAAYCATIERLGLGISEAPVCELLDDAGNVMARVGTTAGYSRSAPMARPTVPSCCTKPAAPESEPVWAPPAGSQPTLSSNGATCPTRG